MLVFRPIDDHQAVLIERSQTSESRSRGRTAFRLSPIGPVRNIWAAQPPSRDQSYITLANINKSGSMFDALAMASSSRRWSVGNRGNMTEPAADQSVLTCDSPNPLAICV